MHVRKLKNGLTEDQVIKARAILKQVNVSSICSQKGIRIDTIYNVLRDESPHVDKLKTVLVEANRQIRRKTQVINALPL